MRRTADTAVTEPNRFVLGMPVVQTSREDVYKKLKNVGVRKAI